MPMLTTRNTITYHVVVKTADDDDHAGTDSNIKVRFHGTNQHATLQLDLDLGGNNDFEKGDCDLYSVSGEDVGPLASVSIIHDGKFASPGWKLAWLKVTAEDSNKDLGTWVCNYNGWINNETKTLPLVSIPGSSDWMKNIPDSTPLHAINIPGTHDSATFNGGGYDQCQQATIAQQLRMGIRFLDIRLRCFINPKATRQTPAKDKEGFTVYHGSNWQKVYFDRDSWIDPADKHMKDFPLQDCLDFLAKNPTECIVMSIKHEYADNDKEKARFAQAFRDLIGRHDTGSNFYTGTQVPTLQQARGRIVFINRDHALKITHVAPGTLADETFGLKWSWPDDDRGIKAHGRLWVEDNYKDTTTDAKVDNIRNNLAAAKKKTGADHTWYATYASCAPGNASPFQWAQTINEWLIGEVSKKPKSEFLGTVIMDYPPMNLINLIIRDYL